MPSISYCITVCNEIKELKSLLIQLIENIRIEDEIIVQVDSENGSFEVKDYLEKLSVELALKKINFHRIFFPLNGDFALFKNNLKEHCTKNWIVQIDADEFFHKNLIQNFPEVLNANNEVDVILIPRVNIVNGLTIGDINKWGWKVDDEGRVNWPDFQMRIWKNKPEIHWKNKVHEQLDGYKSLSHLPFDNDHWALIHIKDIERQRKQNELYSKL